MPLKMECSMLVAEVYEFSLLKTIGLMRHYLLDKVGPDKDNYFNMLYDANYNYYDFNNLDSALGFTRATKLLELMTNSQVIAGFSDSAITLNRQTVSSAGINFGGTSVTDPLDFSRHITLYGLGGFMLRRTESMLFRKENLFLFKAELT